MRYQLGIDTGGTYTDAVLLNAAGEVVAKHKSLTTRRDLALGVDNALAELPPALLRATDLAALSTTLSTNAVVEGRGAPVAILLPGYSEPQINKSGLADILPADCIVALAGGHDATGAELAALDMERAAAAIRRHNDRVSAFAVSGLFGVRNNEHENSLRELIHELSGKPVACGYELAARLGAPRRALTAALNARMIPHIHTLIAAVETILRRRKITAPLMIVKGDGSLVNAATARRQPVATVLSGPAASVLGARALSGKQNAVVADMGGTTTDIAVVRRGRPALCEAGARIGDFQPMVAAMRVFSVGLGGDSEINFNGGLNISRRRVIPLSLLAHQFTQIRPALERQWQGPPSARNNRFAVRLQTNAALLSQLNAAELKVWQRLDAGPLELEALADADRVALRAAAKLERLGLAIYSGFTPSDAMHVLGAAGHWSRPAAAMAAKIWARQMRHVYGCGNWRNGDAAGPSREVFALVVKQICRALIAAGLHAHNKLSESAARNLTQTLTDMILNPAAEKESAPLFALEFAKDFALVAVGAPAAAFFPRVAELLGVELQLPPHLEIANAVGAALGSVAQTARVTVTQPRAGEFYVFAGRRPRRFDNLSAALKFAEESARRAAEAQAKAAGAADITVRIARDAKHIKHDIDGELFVEAAITATAAGRPAFH